MPGVPLATIAIVYAERDVVAPAQFEWPNWCADRPSAGIAIKAGEPVCTVHADGATAAQAKTLVNRRLARVQEVVHDWRRNWGRASTP